jgi:putative addiction module CopG family antidote
MTISLDPDMEKFIADRVKSGRYASPQDVLRAGLATLEKHESIETMSSSELEAIYPGWRDRVAEGVADERAGRISDGEAFFEELEREEQEAE